MPSLSQERLCPEKVGAKKSPKIQLHQQTVHDCFFVKPSTTMCDTATLLMHVEWPPSKECRVPMEVVIKASLASTQEMDINEELKKSRWMTPHMTGTMDIDKKESPEQKIIWNSEKQTENTSVQSVWALFIDTEEMTIEEEVNDNQEDLTKKVKMTVIKTKKQETRNYKHKQTTR